jgi:hypothetical protein
MQTRNLHFVSRFSHGFLFLSGTLDKTNLFRPYLGAVWTISIRSSREVTAKKSFSRKFTFKNRTYVAADQKFSSTLLSLVSGAKFL